jgi:predicted regulator of Ras-like GTPase activity (Roadblock/LC7/MglB family)
MPTSRAATPPLEERVRAELKLIRSNVVGVHGSLVATSDGFLVAHDVPDLEPTEIAALVATTRALATRTTSAAGRGEFREALARGSQGYLAAYAAGTNAIVAVIGTNELNVGMLHFQTREIIERIAANSPEFRKWPSGGSASQAGSHPAGGRAPSAVTKAPSAPPLPRRRPLRRPPAGPPAS